MAKPKSWVKLNRNILEWGWYKDINTKTVFIHLLLKANIEDYFFMGIPVKRGELASSYPKLSAELNMSVQSIRTAILHLKSTGEITVKSYPKFTLFVIENYEKYQDVPEELNKKRGSKKWGNRQNNRQLTADQQASNRPSTGNQQATNRQLTTIKEYKNIRNKEYKENIGAAPASPSAVSEYVPKKWEKDEVPEMLWGKFDSVADWEAWRDK